MDNGWMARWMDGWMDEPDDMFPLSIYHPAISCFSLFFPPFLMFCRIPVVLFLLPGNKAHIYLLLTAFYLSVSVTYTCMSVIDRDASRV